MAKTDRDGRFTIQNLPVGQHVFRLWHERAGYLQDVRIGSLRSDAKGRLTLNIVEGENELAECRLASKMFDRGD
jgi:hypothetical protein